MCKIRTRISIATILSSQPPPSSTLQRCQCPPKCMLPSCQSHPPSHMPHAGGCVTGCECMIHGLRVNPVGPLRFGGNPLGCGGDLLQGHLAHKKQRPSTHGSCRAVRRMRPGGEATWSHAGVRRPCSCSYVMCQPSCSSASASAKVNHQILVPKSIINY